MVTVNRQPTKLDYASPTQFKFTISQLPKVEFFTTAANVPDLTLSDAVIPTPFKPIPVMGTNITFSNLSVTFIVDEFLENYRELHDWLTAIGLLIIAFVNVTRLATKVSQKYIFSILIVLLIMLFYLVFSFKLILIFPLT